MYFMFLHKIPTNYSFKTDDGAVSLDLQLCNICCFHISVGSHQFPGWRPLSYSDSSVHMDISSGEISKVKPFIYNSKIKHYHTLSCFLYQSIFIINSHTSHRRGREFDLTAFSLEKYPGQSLLHVIQKSKFIRQNISGQLAES